MTNSAKYVIVIASLVILGGIGVYGLRNLQDSSVTTAAAVTSTATPKSVSSVSATLSTASSSADVAVQSAEFSSEATDTPAAVESALPTDEPSSTDTTATDTVLNNE